MKQTAALLFDVFGTVVDWRNSLIEQLSAFGAERNISADWTALTDAWRSAYFPSMERVRSGQLPWTKLDDLHRLSLDKLIAEFGLRDLSEDDLKRLNQTWHRLRAWPDSVRGLTRLKSRFIIGPLSNGNVALLTNMAKHADLPWDVVFGSDIFGHFKPDRETYLGACDLLGLPSREVMMCAAHNSDLRSARACGLATAFIARPTEYGPRQRRDFAAEEDWDVVASTIDDLANKLGAPLL